MARRVNRLSDLQRQYREVTERVIELGEQFLELHAARQPTPAEMDAAIAECDRLRRGLEGKMRRAAKREGTDVTFLT